MGTTRALLGFIIQGEGGNGKYKDKVPQDSSGIPDLCP